MHELSWGRHYVAVEPTHFRVDYVINPFMDPDVQPDPGLALAQWHTMVDTLRSLGATVDVVPQRPDAPDMVYAMNLGLGVVRADGTRQVAMSHMRYPQRRMESVTARAWFAAARLRHLGVRPRRRGAALRGRRRVRLR